MSKKGMFGNSEVLRELWSGLLLDLIIKLNREDGPEWEEALKRFLRKENPWGVTSSEFKVLETIKPGTELQPADDFRRALKEGGYMISD